MFDCLRCPSKLHVQCKETSLSCTIQMYVSKSLERVEHALPWKIKKMEL